MYVSFGLDNCPTAVQDAGMGDEFEKHKKVHRICLTGAPAAGKSTALSYLYDKLSDMGFRVFVIPEVARSILGSGVSHKDYVNAGWVLQRSLLRQQISVEETYLALAEGCEYNGKPTVIISDRGRMDVKAFSSPTDWEHISRDYADVDLRDAPYETVIHMVTAAIGAEKAYVNDEVRKETPARAVELDGLILNAWIGHPHVIVVDNRGDGLDGKLKRTLDAVLKSLGHPKSIETERKYLVDKINWERMDALLKYEVVKIEQRYLKGELNRRIRKRGQNGRYVYTYTEKTPIPGTWERMETERQITVTEYNQLLQFCDANKAPIIKERCCFVYEGHYFELDTFGGHLAGLKLLEVELVSKDQPVYLPPFVRIAREVTDNEEYTNIYLSQQSEYGGL